MKVKVATEVLLHMQKAGTLKNKEIVDKLRWSSKGEMQDVRLDKLAADELDELQKLVEGKFAATVKATNVSRRIVTLRKLHSDPSGKGVGRLDALEIALKKHIEQAPRKWLFCDAGDGQMVPHFVESVRYQQGERGSPPRVVVELGSQTRGVVESESIVFHKTDLVGHPNVVELLNNEGWYLESEEAVADYEESLARWRKIYPRTGAQYSAKNFGFEAERYCRGLDSMERDGDMAKVVIDDVSNEDDDKVVTRSTNVNSVTDTFWVDGASAEGDDDGGDEEADANKSTVVLPIHPYLKVFKLDSHKFYLVHVDNLVEYEWDDKLVDKLVMSQEKKDLIEVLVTGAGELMEDIVKGKTGGVVVAASGPPGVGKTLTAEVFGETIKRALYVVQCSQLGTDEESIEKKLALVLTRATRWGAILLIDEADVYVYERGSDIRQNAIVGVFLRTLERYRGILFLTTNRETKMDDAIKSRLTAHVRYEAHTTHELAELWTMLSANYKVPVTPGLVNDLQEEFPKISGREIKNLLKLFTMTNRKRKAAPTLAAFRSLARFQDIQE